MFNPLLQYPKKANFEILGETEKGNFNMIWWGNYANGYQKLRSV